MMQREGGKPLRVGNKKKGRQKSREGRLILDPPRAADTLATPLVHT